MISRSVPLNVNPGPFYGVTQDRLASSATGHLMRMWRVEAPILAKSRRAWKRSARVLDFREDSSTAQPAVRAAVSPPPG